MDKRLRNSASVFALAMALDLSAAQAGALPGHGHFTDGHGTIAKASQSLTVKQSSTTGIIDWNSFSIGRKNSVTFDNGSGATLNRVTSGNLSRIAGSLHATGSLYLMNGAGVIVSGTGHVVTGGSFVAATGNIGDGDRRFKPGAGNIVNKGTIVSGGTTSFSGRNVSETGSIRAAAVNLTAPRDLTIDGHIAAQHADGTGGAMTARARTIVIGADGTVDASASAIGQKGGTISVIARGTTTVAGTLKAEGGVNGAGGFIETSGAHLHVADGAKISTLAADGKTGTWLIDPQDFTIAASGGDITGAALSAELVSNDITIQSSAGANAGNGDIFVDDTVSWSSGHTLTLDAYRNIDIEAAVTVSGAGGLVLIDADQSGTGVNDGNSADGDYFFAGGNISFTGGSGSGATLSINGAPYTLLYSVSDVQNINASNTTLQGDYALATSLDATSTAGWVPIGTDGAGNALNNDNGFAGVFDGLGNTISNLTVNIGSNNYAGLFGYSSGTIRDIGMVGGSVSGGSFVGGLVGQNTGTISDSYATGAVSGTDSVGGLVGENTGTITDTYATGAVSGSTNVGGLVGDNDGTITDTYATGAVSGSTNVGGLVGDDLSLSTTFSYWDTQTSGITDLNEGQGGGVGEAGIVGLTTAQLTAALPSGFDGSVWGNLNNQTTPYLTVFGTAEQQVHVGSDSTDLFNLVFTMAQVQAINASTTALQGNYALATSLDATSTSGWIPIGTDGADHIGNSSHGFSGVFDGLGNTISNLTVDIGSNDYAGLFGYSSGTIHDIGMVGGSVSGGYYTGGLVGKNTGTISGSYATGAVSSSDNQVGGLVGLSNGGTVSDSYATGAVSGGYFVGGLVGESSASTISDSYATGAVSGSTDVGGLVGESTWASIGLVIHVASAISDSYATGAVSGSTDVGGLVGYNDMPDNTISDSYATGAVDTGGDVGGLVGENYGIITNSYWDTETSGTTTGIGSGSSSLTVTGLTTAQLLGGLPSTLPNASWATGAGLFPYLRWQFPNGTPQAVSGFAYADQGVTGVNAGSVSLLIDGEAQTASTGANGYYYFLEAPGTISGSQVLAYLSGTGGAAFADNATGSVSGLDIDNDYLNESTAGSSYATVVSDLSTAIGGNSAVQTIVSGLANLNIDYTGNASFTIDSAISLGGGMLSMTANGAVVQTAAIAATNLLLLGSADYVLTNAGNAIATVAANTSGSLSLTDAGALNVGSVEGTDGLYAGGDVALETTSGGIVLTQLLTANAHSLTLTSGGAITESGSGAIDAASLSGSSDGALALTGANLIANLGAFSTGDNTFSLTDARRLRIRGTVDAGTASLSLTTSGAGHNVYIEGTLSGGAVTLASAGFIHEYLHRGVIDATTLSGSSVGYANLHGLNNSVANLDGFVSGGDHYISLTDDRSLTVEGVLDSGQHQVLIATKGAGHGISLDGTIEARKLTLTSSGGIAEGGSAAIDVTTLTGGSAGATNLTNGENIIADLETFTSGGAFELTDDDNLIVAGVLDAGSHAIDLTTTGSADGLAIDGTIIGGTIDLAATGEATESKMGAIDAIKLLNVTAGTGIELTSKKNFIKKLGTDTTVAGPNKVTL